MKIIEPSFEIIDPVSKEDGVKLLQKIERMARISHRSEDRQTDDSWEKFLKAVVIDHADWSVTEHASATVIFRVDRGITHEIVRHRLFSFTQESTRFVRYGDRHKFEFIQPGGIETDFQSVELFKAHCNNCESVYNTLLSRGGTPQEARAVLPNSLASTIAVTGNLRVWRWFFLARTSRETHPDFKRVSAPLLAEFKNRIPLLYDDVIVNEKQSISMARTH